MSQIRTIAITGERVAWEGNGIYRWNSKRQIWIKLNSKEQSDYINHPSKRTGTFKTIFEHDLI